jgi:hypothetical protein
MMFDFLKSSPNGGISTPDLVSGTALLDRLAGWSTAIATFCIVSLALAAGLAAAYGRELQAGRSPERSWWIARLLLLPLLAIGATAASEAFALSRSATAFTAAMLSLGGYDCLRLIEAHWRARMAALAQGTALANGKPPDPLADEASRG